MFGLAVGGNTIDYLGRGSGSISAVDVGDGARYWKPFRACLGRLKN